MNKLIFFTLLLSFSVLLFSTNATRRIDTEESQVSVVELAEENTKVAIISLEENIKPITFETNISYRPFTEHKEYELGDLMVLDKLFDTENDLLDPNITSLGDLFVLNALFNQYGLNSPDNQYNLGDLFVLDKLFNQDNSNILNQDFSSISDLLILDQLFNN